MVQAATCIVLSARSCIHPNKWSQRGRGGDSDSTGGMYNKQWVRVHDGLMVVSGSDGEAEATI